MKRSTITASGGALAMLMVCAASRAASRSVPRVRYRIVALSAIAGCSLTPNRINNSGDVVGDVVRNGRPNGSVRIFVYRPGSLTVLTRPSPFTEEEAISTRGKVVLLPPLRRGGYSMARDINSAGLVVGMSYQLVTEAPPSHAVYWLHGRIHDLGCGEDEDGRGDALRNNHRGDILGDWQEHDGPTHGYLIGRGHKIWLRALRENDSAPKGLNDQGIVVGSSGTEISRACLWSNGRVHDLNRMIPRNSGWVLESANDINNSGLICGEGRWHGRKRGLLLFPLPDRGKAKKRTAGLSA